MRQFEIIAALCGGALHPEFKQLFERLAVDPRSVVFVRPDGMLQSGPDPLADTASNIVRIASDRDDLCNAVPLDRHTVIVLIKVREPDVCS